MPPTTTRPIAGLPGAARATAARLGWLPIAAPALGLLALAWLLANGVVLEQRPAAGLLFPPAFVGIAPGFVLALLIGDLPREHPRRLMLLAAPAAAMGAATATVVFGTTLLDVPAWWAGGALVSAVPFGVAALAARRTVRPAPARAGRGRG